MGDAVRPWREERSGDDVVCALLTSRIPNEEQIRNPQDPDVML